jgi:PIN domain
MHQFKWFLCNECKTQVHRALAVAPAVVFETYFDRKPPFDGEVSKEFPDGFVLEALRQWCREQDDRMYVVTKDKAMARAVSTDELLLPLKDIHEVLARAAADLGADGEAAAEAVLSEPAFDSTFKAALRAQMKEVVYIYVGDLAEGEAYEGELVSIEEVGNWSVVALSERCVTLILDANVKVRVEVQYENRDGAIYDREDDRWIGTEIASTEVEEEIQIEVLVEVERMNGTVREAKVLTQEVSIYGPSDWE